MSFRCHVMTCYSPQSAGKRNAAYQTTPTGVRRGVMHCGGSASLHCGPARVWMARVEKSGSNETNSRTSTFLGNERTCPSDVVPRKICIALLR